MPGPSLEVRRKIVDFAQGCVGQVDFSARDFDGRPIGVDLIKSMFEAATGLVLQDKDFKKPGTKDEWTWRPKAKDWCGIFVVYCYVSNGLDGISWNLATGKPKGDIKLSKWSKDWKSQMQLADMGVVRTASHHFLIASVPSTTESRFSSVDGNQEWGSIKNKNPDKYVSGTHGFGIDNFGYYQLV